MWTITQSLGSNQWVGLTKERNYINVKGLTKNHKVTNKTNGVGIIKNLNYSTGN